MTKKQAIQLFQERKVRTAWDDQEEKWYFSIADVCGVLTDSDNPQTHWQALKNRLKKEGNETVTNCNQLKLRLKEGKNETVTNCHGLKMLAADGKMRLTDVADTEQLFRIIPAPQRGNMHIAQGIVLGTKPTVIHAL